MAMYQGQVIDHHKYVSVLLLGKKLWLLEPFWGQVNITKAIINIRMVKRYHYEIETNDPRVETVTIVTRNELLIDWFIRKSAALNKQFTKMPDKSYI